MTTQKALHQNRHFKERGLLNSKTNGTTWATNLASKMLNEWLGLWKLRNEDRHGKDRVQKIIRLPVASDTAAPLQEASLTSLLWWRHDMIDEWQQRSVFQVD
jgi:DNA mismatch repair protein MutH